MTSRERIKTIFSGQKADRTGFWLGEPHRDTWPILLQATGQKDPEAVRRMLGDDMRWICPWDAYKHPQGLPMFDPKRKSRDLSAEGIFANCEDVAQVDAAQWPNPDHLDFTSTLETLRNAGEVYRLGGFWCDFFHLTADFFGMENYFLKMFTHPDVVHAVTSHIVDFYLEANRRFFAQAGDQIDAFFFGNDFGTQLDLLIGPAQFEQFVFPYFRQFTQQGHAHGYQVVLHSCGSIYKVIPSLIDLGVDALHPLQAKAANMDASTLARDFKGKVAFLGGIDTQDLLVNGTPEDVRADVRRVKELLSPCLVISPSHECILPNVSPANVMALADEACRA